VNQDYIRRLELLNVLSGMRVVCVSGKTDVLNREFHFDLLIVHNDGLRPIHYLFSKGALNRITCENNSVLGVWGPFHKKISRVTVLKHTRAGHND